MIFRTPDFPKQYMLFVQQVIIQAFILYQMIEEADDTLDIKKQCHNYSTICSQVSNQTDLIVVVGGCKAGKSITVDLFAGRQLTIYRDEQLGTETIVALGNKEQSYPPVYVVNDRATTIMQCFTLNQQGLDSKIQVLKLIYLQRMMEVAGRVSLVFVFDETMVNNHLLRCIGITGQQLNPNTDILKDYVYFFVTKTEPGAYEEVKQIICDLQTATNNQNVASIIEHTVRNDNMAQFKIQVPTKSFQTAIRNQFYPKQNPKQLRDILINSSIRQYQTQSEGDKKLNQQITQLFGRIGKIITSLALLSSKKQAKYRKNIENITRQSNIKLQLDLILSHWSINQLKIPQLQIPHDFEGRKKIEHLSQVLISILCSFQRASPQPKQDLIYLKQSLLFCSKLGHWFPLDSQASELQQIFGDIDEIIREMRAAQKPTPIIHRPAPKKKPTPFSIFKEDLQNYCTTNQEAIRFCIEKIIQKQQSANFEFNQVIFLIKMLRDLMEQFYQHDKAFIYQLLSLALYSQNFCIFKAYLLEGLSYGILEAAYLLKIVRILLNYNKFEECQLIIKYLQALTPGQSDRRRLQTLKRQIHKKQQEQYKNVHEVELKLPPQSKKIDVSFQTIQQKARSNKRLIQMLSESTFLRYLGNTNE